MSSLKEIIVKLEKNNLVDSCFLTGSLGDNTATPNSDIDLIIILKENKESIESIFTWIDGVFADVYFFSQNNLRKIEESPFLLFENSEAEHKMLTFLYNWSRRASIQFDKSGLLTRILNISREIKINDEKKYRTWLEVNYNLESNTRYFKSGKSNYLEALEMRLLYSVIGVVCAYFDFKDEQWQGEKKAIQYFKTNDEKFYDLFKIFSKSVNIEEKFKFYSQMATYVLLLNSQYPKWNGNEIIAKPNNKQLTHNDENLIKFWENLIK